MSNRPIRRSYLGVSDAVAECRVGARRVGELKKSTPISPTTRSVTTGWLHRGYRWSLRACAQRGTPTSISECSFATLSHQNVACLWPPTAGLPGLPNSNLPAARPGGYPASSPAPRSRQGRLGKPCPARDLARTGSESAEKEVAWQGYLALASNCLRCFWKAEARLDRPSFQVVPKLSPELLHRLDFPSVT